MLRSMAGCELEVALRSALSPHGERQPPAGKDEAAP